MNDVKVMAKLKNLDITPRKMRRVTELIKGLQVDNALAELSVNTTRGAASLKKLINSAVASAKEKKLNPDKLVVGSIRVDAGRSLKRLLPQGRGRANLIRKRFSHITVELMESEKAKPKGFVMPKKAKKAREASSSPRPAPKLAEERTALKEQKGFMQKVFRRKAV